MDSSQEIAALGKTDESRPLVVGSRVIDKLLTANGALEFPRTKYLFLQLLRRGTSIEEAALKVKIDLDEAKRFEASPKAQEYLQDRELAAILAEEAKDPDRFWVRLNAILEGEIDASKAQIEALKMVASRVSPTTGDGHSSGATIQININPSAVQEAFRRNQAIDAQIVGEQQ